MSDNNNTGAEVIPITFIVGGIVTYHNRAAILKFLENILIRLMWIGIYVSIATAIAGVIYWSYKSLHKKYVLCLEWIANVERIQKEQSDKIQKQKDYIDWLKSCNSSHITDIKNLKTEIEKLKPKEKPKDEVVKLEAMTKTEEAIQQIVSNLK